MELLNDFLERRCGDLARPYYISYAPTFLMPDFSKVDPVDLRVDEQQWAKFEEKTVNRNSKMSMISKTQEKLKRGQRSEIGLPPTCILSKNSFNNEFVNDLIPTGPGLKANCIRFLKI